MKKIYHDLKEVLGHKMHRAALVASFSSLRNIAYSLGMFGLGLMSHSAFLLTNGTYQLALSLMRLLNVRFYAKRQRGQVVKIGRASRITGTLLVVLGLAYIGINFLLYIDPQDLEVSKHTMLMTASLAFVKLGSSIWGISRNRKNRLPEVRNIRLISLVDAMVSIVTTQRVILTFEEGGQRAAQSTPIFGMGIGVCFILIGFYIFWTSRRRPMGTQKNQPQD